MVEKKYYWLKLRDDFFTSKRIKKLRNLAGGDTYLIIYLKMQLIAMKNGGIIHWTGLEDDVAAELALDLDEKTDDVSVTLMYLLQTGLAETSDNIDFFFPYAVENTGSETSASERKRRSRERNLLPQGCDNVTPMSHQCHTDVTPMSHQCHTEIEKEKDIEIESEKEIEKEPEIERKSASAPPTLDDVKEFCLERRSPVNPVRFWQYYDGTGWKDGGGHPIQWKEKLIAWEKKDAQKQGGQQKLRPNQVQASCKNYPEVKLDDLWAAIDKL